MKQKLHKLLGSVLVYEGFHIVFPLFIRYCVRVVYCLVFCFCPCVPVHQDRTSFCHQHCNFLSNKHPSVLNFQNGVESSNINLHVRAKRSFKHYSNQNTYLSICFGKVRLGLTRSNSSTIQSLFVKFPLQFPPSISVESQF